MSKQNPGGKSFSDAALHRMSVALRRRYFAHDTTPPLLTAVINPARRHRCELCRQIFECHLCSVGRDHPMHFGIEISAASHATVCEACIEVHGLHVVLVTGKNTLRAYDHLSGEYLGTVSYAVEFNGSTGHMKRSELLLKSPVKLKGGGRKRGWSRASERRTA